MLLIKPSIGQDAMFVKAMQVQLQTIKCAEQLIDFDIYLFLLNEYLICHITRDITVKSTTGRRQTIWYYGIY